MITFGSDVADLILQRTLGENTLGLNNSINRMTTGYKVNQAKDNAAGYSIITDLSKKISSMLQVQQNTEAVSYTHLTSKMFLMITSSTEYPRTPASRPLSVPCPKPVVAKELYKQNLTLEKLFLKIFLAISPSLTAPAV